MVLSKHAGMIQKVVEGFVYKTETVTYKTFLQHCLLLYIQC